MDSRIAHLNIDCRYVIRFQSVFFFFFLIIAGDLMPVVIIS